VQFLLRSLVVHNRKKAFSKLLGSGRSHSLLTQLLIGLLFSVFATVFQLSIWSWVGGHQLLLLLPAVALASVFGGGLPAGIAATLTGALFWGLFLFPRVHGDTVLHSSDWVGLNAFVLSGAWIALLGSRRMLSLYRRADEFERLEYAVLAAKVGVWEWDVVHDRTIWDDQMLQFYGLKREDFGGTVAAWKSGIHPEDVQFAADAVELALAGKKDFDLDFRVVRPDGTVRTLHASALVRRDSSGRPLAMYGLNRDVTEQRRTLSELQEYSAFFQAAMDQSQVGIVIVDAPSGAVRFANDAALAIRGGSRQALLEGVRLGHYAPWRIKDLGGQAIPDQETPLARSFLHGEKVSQEVLMMDSNDVSRVVLTHTAPIRRPDGSIMAGIAVFIDNTERHQLLEQLKAAREAAERASGAKSRFLDIAAHELRTPVTAFSLLLQVTQKQLAEGIPVDASVLVRLRAQVDRLARLVVDLLEVSRLDRGLLILKREVNDLGHLIAECVSNFKLQFPERDLKLIGNGRFIGANIDPVRIYEVISNLIDNAIKYTPAQSPIEIVIEDLGDRVRLLIKDRGPGIAIERLSTLFNAFERGSSSEEEQHSGLGLGLYICRKIVELHGGTVGVKSVLGEGSEFYFEIPKDLSGSGSGEQVAS